MKINILSIPFQVSYYDDPIGLDPANMGLCDFINTSIAIREGMPQTQKRAVLVHEILHAIDNALCLELNETKVAQLGTALTTVLADNPEFVKMWIPEKSK